MQKRELNVARIYPFRAYRPPAEFAEKVASVPYDVVSEAEAEALAGDNEKSFLRVTRSEIGLRGVNRKDAQAVVLESRKIWEEFIAKGWLLRDEQAGYYLYQLQWRDVLQTGVCLTVDISDYEENIVRKHELTRPAKEQDRAQHIDGTGLQTGVVFLVHRENSGIGSTISKVVRAEPDVSFCAVDGVHHRMWRVCAADDIAALTRGFAAVGPLYIADGHHRSAAALRVALQRRAAGKSEGGDNMPSERLLAVSFPSEETRILPYHRWVNDLGEMTEAQFLSRLGEVVDLQCKKPDALEEHEFGVFVGAKWYVARFREAVLLNRCGAERLDSAILAEVVLGPLLGIVDQRRDERIDFVGGIRGIGELERRVHSEGGAAFYMQATAIEDLLEVADAGECMPPKSTWFEPKLRDGLVVYSVDEPL